LERKMKHVDPLVERFPALGDLRHENWGGIPLYMREPIVGYLLEGQPLGGFLTAVIDGDLFGAVSRADGTNIHLLREYGRFFLMHTPRGSYGYPGAVKKRVEEFQEKRKELADGMDT